MSTCKLFARIAAVLLCGAICTGAWAGVFSCQLTQPGDFAGGIFERTEISDATGGPTLMRSMNSVPFLWVPIPGAGVVSKIDARSGAELARYRMGPQESPWSPCAVATDSSGNAYVACGSECAGKIVKILASGASKFVLRDPECTSFDTNGDGLAEALPWGKDSRVTLVTEVGASGSKPSALAFSESGLLWVGLWGEQSVVAVDLGTQTLVKTVVLPGNPDTIFAGSNGSLWIVCGDAKKICAVDTLLGYLGQSYDLGEDGAKSLFVDDDGYAWLGTSNGLVCMRLSEGSSSVTRLADGAGLAGVAIDRKGDIWAACPSTGQLVCFSGADLSEITRVAVGRGPNSVCVDADGYVWSLNTDSTASRVDPRQAKLTATIAMGGSPVSSTPFAASILKRGYSPSGSWRMLFDSGIPGGAWGTIGWQSASCGGHLKVEARSADTPAAIGDQAFIEVGNGMDFAVPNGEYLEVKVSFTGGNNTRPVLQGLAVQGRNLPPDVSHVTPSVDRILKLDHSYQTVAITGVSDPEGDPINIEITRVTQDEPLTPLSSDDKGPDAIGIGASEVQLRGECDPGTLDKPGNGRVYTVSFQATDAMGASSMGKVKVTVPPILTWNAVAVEDGHRYDSTKDPEKNKDDAALVASL